ncbi:hypothetical protein L5515_013636 [Caenorhabditis briggsae]|uniref:Uncharacterized protein n=1 Tax=Caenorhabditis briggsae TaxID=6238 RepID=A0AAE9EB58_CAEBR|nr:hypothetical protein L5515_013636 [Caenorhabditis briggsae]
MRPLCFSLMRVSVSMSNITSTKSRRLVFGLDWIENNMDPLAAGSKAIVVIVGFNEDRNPGATMFTITDLRAKGYQFMSVSV